MLVIVKNKDEALDYKEKIKDLKKQNKILVDEALKINDSILKLKYLTQKQQIKVDSLIDVKSKFKIIRDEIPSNVDAYPDSKLDSILTTYKHPG
ncbi:hypothetical protein [Changchengzhania lutea]|uniref:hypothetical protein n=1 Tax=Changchengzhania lutea TaxID=2049305 RepID=UPI00163DC77F|nr:hypothetical protein [Changchengzhania lutea]